MGLLERFGRATARLLWELLHPQPKSSGDARHFSAETIVLESVLSAGCIDCINSIYITLKELWLEEEHYLIFLFIS